jgi:hypothetical protein
MAALSMHGLFTIAFVAGFAVPLAAAGAEARIERAAHMKERGSALELVGPIIDLWLLIQDAIPVFWLFRLVSEAPDDVRAAKKHWREESMVRWCFWISVILLATLPLYLFA